MRKSALKAFTFLVLVMGITLPYQNCAQVPGLAGHATVPSPVNESAAFNDPNQVHLIDPTPQTTFQLSFTTLSPIVVDSRATSVLAEGGCSLQQQGALLRYKMIDPRGQELISDLVPCEAGGVFHVDAPLNNVVCGAADQPEAYYTLSAQLGTGAPAKVEFVLLCH